VSTVITGPAQKDINTLPAGVRSRVIVELARIAAGTARIEKMKEPPPRWKVRVGDYRIILSIDEGAVTILKVKHRREVYRLFAVYPVP
jgi:mRNA-degrading endonuclease RelE of RelBE toxin-antitoxin system